METQDELRSKVAVSVNVCVGREQGALCAPKVRKSRTLGNCLRRKSRSLMSHFQSLGQL
jgi:hypothetical protein